MVSKLTPDVIWAPKELFWLLEGGGAVCGKRMWLDSGLKIINHTRLGGKIRDPSISMMYNTSETPSWREKLLRKSVLVG